MDINTVEFQNLPKLTPRQGEILALISQSIEESGLPPTRAEIATRLGFASANAAEEHLRALARKGYVELSPGTSRGIRIPPKHTQSRAHLAYQMALPSGALQQLTLPLIGRVAAGSPIMAIEHKTKKIYGIQFHPEKSHENGLIILKNFFTIHNRDILFLENLY